jgi:chromosome segregation ATPase
VDWQVVSLVEALGALRSRFAELCRELDRERRELAQKLEAAEDALERLELSHETQRQEVERLQRELATVVRERDEARRLPVKEVGPEATRRGKRKEARST